MEERKIGIMEDWSDGIVGELSIHIMRKSKVVNKSIVNESMIKSYCNKMILS